MKVRKTFVLDTNVILFDPRCIFKFGKNDVHIPLICVEELDRFKKDQNENGRNARTFSRVVDDLRSKGSLSKGVMLDDGGKLIIGHYKDYPEDLTRSIDLSKNDNLILGAALILKEKDKNVILISKDINLRLKADVLGVASQDYNTEDITLDELYSGQRKFKVTPKQLEEFKEKRFLPVKADEFNGLYSNEYVELLTNVPHENKNPDNYSDMPHGSKFNHDKNFLGRYSAKQGGIVPLHSMKEGIWGIYPKNQEQHFAFDALMSSEFQLVSLVGKAGTGKTLLAMAAGLELCINRQKYSRVLVSRPIQPMGKDLGFLPGDIEEKISPWMWPIYDALDFLFGQSPVEKNGNQAWDNLLHRGLLHVEPLTYIRGRSIPSQFIIIDESQNLSPHEIKTIITRAGEGSKIILTGDCEQIDNPYLDSVNNGLAHVVERLKNEEITSHVTLKTGERSQLSEVASKLL